MNNRKKRMTGSYILALSLVMAMAAGCAHQLDIKNIEKYRTFAPSSMEKPLKIGIISNTLESEQKQLLYGTAYALNECSMQVAMPYAANGKTDVDVVAYLDITTEHSGSGWNFLINFPGFIVFTPAWHGYMYKVTHTVHCTLVKGRGSKDVIDQFKIPIALDIRHAEMNRTWTEISFFDYGILAFIGGIVYIRYDETLSPLLGEKTASPLGKYIANEILTRINKEEIAKPKPVQ